MSEDTSMPYPLELAVYGANTTSPWHRRDVYVTLQSGIGPIQLLYAKITVKWVPRYRHQHQEIQFDFLEQTNITDTYKMYI